MPLVGNSRNHTITGKLRWNQGEENGWQDDATRSQTSVACSPLTMCYMVFDDTEAMAEFYFSHHQTAWCRFEKTWQNHVAVFLRNRNRFLTKRALKTWKRKDSLPRSTFRRAKPMLLPFKNYGFTAPKLWFRTSKPMLLQPETYVFLSKHLISLFKTNSFSV